MLGNRHLISFLLGHSPLLSFLTLQTFKSIRLRISFMLQFFLHKGALSKNGNKRPLLIRNNLYKHRSLWHIPSDPLLRAMDKCSSLFLTSPHTDKTTKSFKNFAKQANDFPVQNSFLKGSLVWDLIHQLITLSDYYYYSLIYTNVTWQHITKTQMQLQIRIIRYRCQQHFNSKSTNPQ